MAAITRWRYAASMTRASETGAIGVLPFRISLWPVLASRSRSPRFSGKLVRRRRTYFLGRDPGGLLRPMAFAKFSSTRAQWRALFRARSSLAAPSSLECAEHRGAANHHRERIIV